MDNDLAFAPRADVVRGRSRIGADAGDVDQALYAGLARQPGDARRRLDVDSAEGLVATTLDIEADGVDGPVGVGQRRSDRGLVVHIGTDRLRTHLVRPEERRHALRVARGGPHPEASIEQMPDHPAPEKAGPAEHCYKPPAALSALPGTSRRGGHWSRPRWWRRPPTTCALDIAWFPVPSL